MKATLSAVGEFTLLDGVLDGSSGFRPAILLRFKGAYGVNTHTIWEGDAVFDTQASAEDKAEDQLVYKLRGLFR